MKKKEYVFWNEVHSLTRIAIRHNKYTEFDAEFVLINVSEDIFIDVNNFNYITAKVLQVLQQNIQLFWILNQEKQKN